MSDVIFNEWDYMPISLSPEEVANPLAVLNDFFSSDWLPGHYEDLLRWRKYILADESFVDPNGNPVSLLLSYKLNIKLADASFLILERFKSSDDAFQVMNIKDSGQLSHERQTWRDFPKMLSDEQLLNPVLVLEQFFFAFSLPVFRSTMYEWLEAGLSSHSIGEFFEASDIFAMYENLQSLYGAAWLIYQGISIDPYLKVTEESAGEAEQVKNHNNGVNLYKLNSIITSVENRQLSDLVNIIKEAVPSIQGIIYLGVPPIGANVIFLLALTDNYERRTAQEVSHHLEELCKKVANVFILVHHAASLVTATDEKNVFLLQAANCPVIYLSGGLILPKRSIIDQVKSTEIAIRKWERWHTQSIEFLRGAEYYLSIGAHNAALFSLNQTAECLLVAIIRFVTGYDINSHNLERLLVLTQMFTNDFNDIFDLNDANNKATFNILKNAYIDVRYRDSFIVDANSVTGLYALIKSLTIKVAEVQQKQSLCSTL